VSTVDGSYFAYLIECSAVDPSFLFAQFADKTIANHNTGFDLSFLRPLGLQACKVKDTMIMSQMAHGVRHPKGFHSLAECASRELGKTVNKALQKSNWAGSLNAEQLRYAADDVLIIPPLLEALEKRIKESGQEKVAKIEHRCLPAWEWLESNGVSFDLDAWNTLAKDAQAEVDTLLDQLNRLAPRRNGALPMAENTNPWNWNSQNDVKTVLASLNFTLDSTDDEALASINHPLADLLRRYRSSEKRLSTYGREWKKFLKGGRIYADWKQIGAESGRTSCSNPNLQNLPRDPRYRKCFLAPPGRVLIKADYSQIELRIAAKISGDAKMIIAFQSGQDLHALTASLVLNKQLADVDKDDRRIAKAINFGLLYGMGWRGFQRYANSNYGLGLTEQQARSYRKAFFAAYPGLARWHRQVMDQHAGETRTLTGRRRLFKVEESDTFRLNTPVQGTGADGAKLAMALLWERRGACPGAFPVLFIHDEIVVETDEGQADVAAAWLKQAMLDGMQPLIAPVPVEVEIKIGSTWAGN
jgi:DNA polymerase-1